jgi:hypothetical protein
LHTNFSKEKKEKKKAIYPSGGFQKSRFFEKILPGYFRKNVPKLKIASFRCASFAMTNEGGDFFKNPQGMNEAFLNTRNLSLISFFIFLEK